MASSNGQTPAPLTGPPPAAANAIPRPAGSAPPAEFLPGLLTELSEHPYRFDFFRALRQLQCAASGFPRIGASKSPGEDPIRFGQRPSLSFAPSTLDGLQFGAPPRLFVNFFGLFGPSGPLPLHLTEYALRRQLNHDSTLAAFFDVFHHRLISLFFRAWACNQQTVDVDRPGEQRFPFYIGSSFGLASETNEHGDFQPHPDPLPPSAKLFYAGNLAGQTRHAEGLQAILQDYFGESAEVLPFQGRWLDLPPENRCKLGASPDTGTLGATAIAGSRIWDSQIAFRVRLGPMRFSDFSRFLPGSPSLARLRSWIAHYAGAQYLWDLQVVLAASQIPETVLSSDRPPQLGRLGQTTWLKSQPSPRDSDDMILNPD